MVNLLKYSKSKKYIIANIINEILKYTDKWKYKDKAACAWYRGQDGEFDPTPSIFRKNYDEFNLNTMFRNRATALKDTPETGRMDKWLFLMQHYGAPTRLLDWTESLTNALYFALDSFYKLCECKKKKQNPTIWVIHPYELNEISGMDFFPNTWVSDNFGCEYFKLSFFQEKSYKDKRVIYHDLSEFKYPIAIQANYSDMRLFSQQSCFTIHGTEKKGFCELLKNTSIIAKNHFLKFVIPNKYAKKLYNEVKAIGIKETNIFPDLDSLAKELKYRFER